jgi:hypothetical protein
VAVPSGDEMLAEVAKELRELERRLRRERFPRRVHLTVVERFGE